jgi:hypothetical protein
VSDQAAPAPSSASFAIDGDPYSAILDALAAVSPKASDGTPIIDTHQAISAVIDVLGYLALGLGEDVRELLIANVSEALGASIAMQRESGNAPRGVIHTDETGPRQ